MRCDEFELRFHQALDRRQCPEDDPDLAAHALLCHHCAQAQLAWQMIEQELDSDALPALPDDFGQRVAGMAAAERLPAVSSRWSAVARQAATMAAALAAVLMMGLAAMWHVSAQIDSQLAARTSSNVADLGPLGPPHDSRGAEHVDGRPPGDLGARPKETWSWGFSWQDLPPALAFTGPDGEPGPGALTIQRFAGGLRPVASSLSTAWQLLRERIPPFLGGDEDAINDGRATA